MTSTDDDDDEAASTHMRTNNEGQPRHRWATITRHSTVCVSLWPGSQSRACGWHYRLLTIGRGSQQGLTLRESQDAKTKKSVEGWTVGCWTVCALYQQGSERASGCCLLACPHAYTRTYIHARTLCGGGGGGTYLIVNRLFGRDGSSWTYGRACWQGHPARSDGVRSAARRNSWPAARP